MRYQGDKNAGGLHIIADLKSNYRLSDPDFIGSVLTGAAQAAKATLLDVRLHHFGGGNGVTGVALLAESHISIHTWPEWDLAAIDIFTCGIDAAPQAGLDHIVTKLRASVISQQNITRLI